MTQITFHFPNDYLPSPLHVTCPHSLAVHHLLFLRSPCSSAPVLPTPEPFAFGQPGHRGPLSRAHYMLENLTLNPRFGPWRSRLRGSPTPLVSSIVSEQLLFRYLAMPLL